MYSDRSSRSDEDTVRRLSSVTRADLQLVGGKAANLGEMIQLGMAVPRGFVITAGACERYHTKDKTNDQSFVNTITTMYDEMGLRNVAVRSSATTEDLAGAASAGLHDTFLNVSGVEDVIDRVGECWKSLHSERAVDYRRERTLDASTPRMAVIIQEMVPAESAGVLFTANPVTGSRSEMIVTAVAGLGESLVSGAEDGEEWTFQTKTSRTRRVIDPRRKPSAPIVNLNQEAVDCLISNSAALEIHFGYPQDIEWAYHDGTIWMLQSRPITALPPPPLPIKFYQRDYLLTIAEMLPVRPYPMDMTTWLKRGPGTILARMANELAGIQVDLTQSLPTVDGVVDSLRPMKFKPTWKMPVRLLSSLLRAFTQSTIGWSADPLFKRFERELQRLDSDDILKLSLPQLTRRMDQVYDTLDVLIDLRVKLMPSAAAELAVLKVWLALNGKSSEFGACTAGAMTMTKSANEALLGVKGSGNDESDASTLLGSTEFERRIEEYVRDFGHRETTSGLLISQPSVGEDLDAVRSAAMGLTQRARKDESKGMVIDKASKSDSPLHGSLRDRITRKLSLRAQSATAFREDTHFHAMRLFPVARSVIRELGTRLTMTGVLQQDTDIWHLTWPEVQSILGPDGPLNSSLDDAINTRKARRQVHAGAPLVSPRTFAIAKSAKPADSLATGAGASSGVSTGAVRVISNTGDFHLLRAGEVLVCRYTNPTWTVLFSLAAAVVVDTGSLGSHAAIIAREYGIPAVMGTGTGTKELSDGQWVEVDGNTGIVRAANRP